MQEKDYTNYSAEELLEDDFFLKSFSSPTPESQSFWEELKKENEALAKEVMIASGILLSIPYRKRLSRLMTKTCFGKRFARLIIKNDSSDIGIPQWRLWQLCY